MRPQYTLLSLTAIFIPIATAVDTLSTLTLTLPTQGKPFRSTVSACETVPPFVIVGHPNATFNPGVQTVFLPPQASAISTSFTNKKANLTEVIIATPLPGGCVPLSLPAAATATIVTPIPSPSSNLSSFLPSSYHTPSPPTPSSVCSINACAHAVINATAQEIISVLNEITISTQTLEAAALELGRGSGITPRFDVLTALVLPLEEIAAAITFSLRMITAHPPFPRGCDTDAIVAGLGAFVDAQTTLLEILLGRADMLGLDGGPIRRAGGKDVANENISITWVDHLIVSALKLIRKGVDELAYDLISILPAGAECLQRDQQALDDTLDEVIAAYE